MLPHVPSESSTLAINYMKKHFDLSKELDVIEFLMKDLDKLETIMSKACDMIQVYKNQRLPETISNSSEFTYLSHQENWM